MPLDRVSRSKFNRLLFLFCPFSCCSLLAIRIHCTHQHHASAELGDFFL